MFNQIANGGSNPNKDLEVASPPEDTVSALEFSPPSVPQNFLIAGSWDCRVRCWEVEASGKTVPKAVQGMDGPILDVAWHDDGTKVFMASADKSVKCWDLASNQTVQVAAHDLAIKSCHWVKASNYNCLMTAGWDKALKVILGHSHSRAHHEHEPVGEMLLRRCGVPDGGGGHGGPRHQPVHAGGQARRVQARRVAAQAPTPLHRRVSRQEDEAADGLRARQRRGPRRHPVCEPGQPQGQLHLQVSPLHAHRRRLPGHLRGERHRVPPGARHARHGRLRRLLLLLGQGRAHQAQELRDAGPAAHQVRLQPQRTDLRVRRRLRLVQGVRALHRQQEALHLPARLLRRAEAATLLACDSAAECHATYTTCIIL